MKYFSLNHKSPTVDFKTATINGQAPDKGLYFPETIPTLSKEWFANLHSYSKADIAFDVISPFVGNCIDESSLRLICAETVDFEFPLVQVEEGVFSLELFHGPTLAFKDVGARFMSRCLGHFSKNNNKEITVLVATSGDTGGAVANGFFNVPGVRVVVLYPSGRVSPVQELQLAHLGGNITALEVNGTFDDCQALVKQAFADEELRKRHFLTSANSINIARWLPQQFYYFYALQQWKGAMAPVISVPSGNFGNIAAGIMAYRQGLPVEHFVAACNVNDVFTRYIHSGEYAPSDALATLSNAMDVGNPSNFVRVVEMFEKSHATLTQKISSQSVNDQDTRRALVACYQENKYTLDPHGAVAFLALKDYLKNHPGQKGLFLETAHPVKFPQAVEDATGQKINIPESVKTLQANPKSSIVIESTYAALLEQLG